MSTSNAMRARQRAERTYRRIQLSQKATFLKREALERNLLGIKDRIIWEVYEDLRAEARK